MWQSHGALRPFDQQCQCYRVDGVVRALYCEKASAYNHGISQIATQAAFLFHLLEHDTPHKMSPVQCTSEGHSNSACTNLFLGAAYACMDQAAQAPAPLKANRHEILCEVHMMPDTKARLGRIVSCHQREASPVWQLPGEPDPSDRICGDAVSPAMRLCCWAQTG